MTWERRNMVCKLKTVVSLLRIIVNLLSLRPFGLNKRLFIATCFCCFINMQIKKICIRFWNRFKPEFLSRPCFQLVFYWVSKLVHLTRIRCSGWLRVAWIKMSLRMKVELVLIFLRGSRKLGLGAMGRGGPKGRKPSLACSNKSTIY